MKIPCLLAALLAVAPAVADTITRTSAADNTIIENPTGALSAGASQFFLAGRVPASSGGTIRRGVIRFDLSGIPAGSTITGVSLRLNCSSAGTGSQQTIAIKRMLSGWGEGASQSTNDSGAPSQVPDATWLHRFFSTTAWSTPGGDFSSATTVSRAVTTTGLYLWNSTPQFVADVQSMIANPALNFGWCVQGEESAADTLKRFDSREASVAASRPQLTVNYLPPTVYDLNGDNRVNAQDVAILLGSWSLSGTGDFNGDGSVNSPDLAILLGAWTG